jgi:hypothetical protein
MSKKSDQKPDRQCAVARPTPTILRLFSETDATPKHAAPDAKDADRSDNEDDDPGPTAA